MLASAEAGGEGARGEETPPGIKAATEEGQWIEPSTVANMRMEAKGPQDDLQIEELQV